MELSPIEIIAKGWDNALFTTYALSLRLFRDAFNQELSSSKPAVNIWVVADVDGYQQSLA